MTAAGPEAAHAKQRPLATAVHRPLTRNEERVWTGVVERVGGLAAAAALFRERRCVRKRNRGGQWAAIFGTVRWCEEGRGGGLSDWVVSRCRGISIGRGV